MMTSVELERKLERSYWQYLHAWLTGTDESFFPLRFALGTAPSDDIGALREFTSHAQALTRLGLTLAVETRNTRRHGMQRVPTHLVVENAAILLKRLCKEAEFDAFVQDVALLRQHFVALESWIIQHPKSIIDFHEDWADLLKVCDYFVQHPRPGLYLRELPISVHTKFVEEHKSILRDLLDVLLPKATIIETPFFEKRFGLRWDEPLIRLRLLDITLSQKLGWPFQHVSVPLSELASYSLSPYSCVIVENKMTFLTLPPLQQTFAIWGKGFQVEALRELSWLYGCAIYYWGDLDIQGFHILAQLRHIFPDVKSVLMDQKTLETFANYTVKGVPQAGQLIEGLTAEEVVLAHYLQQENIRLEQERISHLYSSDYLRQAV